MRTTARGRTPVSPSATRPDLRAAIPARWARRSSPPKPNEGRWAVATTVGVVLEVDDPRRGASDVTHLDLGFLVHNLADDLGLHPHPLLFNDDGGGWRRVRGRRRGFRLRQFLRFRIRGRHEVGVEPVLEGPRLPPMLPDGRLRGLRLLSPSAVIELPSELDVLLKGCDLGEERLLLFGGGIASTTRELCSSPDEESEEEQDAHSPQDPLRPALACVFVRGHWPPPKMNGCLVTFPKD